jgi:hypothetical protein
MSASSITVAPEVFISYASRDRKNVTFIVDILKITDVSLWIDHRRLEGGKKWAQEIVRAIKKCKLIMLMCSDAAMRSRAVSQEIQLAWKYELNYLPLLLERTSFPEQLEFFLEGCQWVEVLDRPPDRWLPEVLQALTSAGVHCREPGGALSDSASPIVPCCPSSGLDGLWSLARLTDRIWPLVVEGRDSGPRGITYAVRGLGAPQPGVQHQILLGSRLFWAIQWEDDAHLLLLDHGSEGKTYCLCPSWFVPTTRLRPGLALLPSEEAHCEPFVLTGVPGREYVLAIISEQPLELNWMPPDSSIPARVLDDRDLSQLTQLLRRMRPGSWTALATYFDVVV